MGSEHFAFPVGYHRFHTDQVFNYQVNRWHSLGYLAYDHLKTVGASIHKFIDWQCKTKPR